jgi:copper chaperone NosL
MVKLFSFTAGVLLLSLFACSSGPQPLRYGQDNCSHCKMSISDKRFGAEIVTNKGKVFKYDAIECMLAAIREDGKLEVGETGFWVVDASNPGTLIDAKSAHYLISDKLPSPMGANISGFSSNESLQSALREFGGKTNNWKELKESF